MNNTETPTTTNEAFANTEHSAECTRPGFRYATTVPRNARTIENGMAGRVLMVCKNGRCPARRYA